MRSQSKNIFISIILSFIALSSAIKVQQSTVLSNTTTISNIITNATTGNISNPMNNYLFNNLTSTNGTLALIPFASPYGKVIYEQNSMPLYMNDGDSDNGKSICYGSCADNWPPLRAPSGPISVAGELDKGHVKTIQRTDGYSQVVFNGRPLYYYSGDNGTFPNGQALKDTLGQRWLLKEDGTSDESTSTESSKDIRSSASDVRDAEQRHVDNNRNQLNNHRTDADASLTLIADTIAVAAANAVLNASSNVIVPNPSQPNVTPVITNN